MTPRTSGPSQAHGSASGAYLPRLLLLGFLLTLLHAVPASAKKFTLKIIAFNDFHGNLQPSGKYRANANSPDVPVGGADVLAGYVKELEAQNPNYVVVGAGDIIGASPLVSALFHDEATVEVMNRLGLQITSVGNHEFDQGVQELKRMQSGGCSTKDRDTCEGAKVGTPVPFEGAKFQYLAANVFDAATGKTILPGYAIKTYNGVRVAFIGVVLQSTPSMVTPSGIAGVRFADEATTINSVVSELKKQGIRTFVVLIHQGGYQSTKGIADINACEGGMDGWPIKTIVNQLDDGVDLVVSGHTHVAYVCQLAGRTGRKITVTSAALYGRVLTDINMTLDTATQKAVEVTAHNIVVDRTNPKIVPDAEVKAIVDRYAALAAPFANRVVGSITAEIPKTLDDVGESRLGDLTSDSYLEATRTTGGAVVAFMNEGGVRASLPYSSGITGDGKVTYGEIYTVEPFGNSLVTMTLTGAQIKTLLEQQFKGCALDFPAGDTSGQTSTKIMQVSAGFTYTWNPAGPVCHKVDSGSIQLNGVTLVPEQKYRVTANSFMAEGGDDLYEFTRGTDRVGGGQDIDALAAYFANHPSVAPGPADRIKIASQPNP